MDIKSYTDKIYGFIQIGNYHAAVNIAISGLNECRRNDDPVGIDKFVSIIKGISLTIAHEFGSRSHSVQGKEEGLSCFLCGVAEENARLLLGASGSICSNCAEYAYKYFADSENLTGR